MKVAHIALTPVAGSPIRIVKALNQYTDVESRLIVFDTKKYGNRTFEQDLDFLEHQALALQWIMNCDVLHLHQYFDLKHNVFGIDFEKLAAEGKKIVRQWHSVPLALSGGDALLAQKIVQDRSVAQLVVVQHQERFYPYAQLVPNLVETQDFSLKTPDEGKPIVIFFAPTVLISAHKSRWDTKGFVEVLPILKALKRQYGKKIGIDVVRNVPHDVLLSRKQQADIVIDEVATGSYHLSALEALAMGKPTLCYIDLRTEWVLKNFIGVANKADLPFVNCNLLTLKSTLIELIEDKNLRLSQGSKSRLWIECHWNEVDLVQHYVQVYRDLYENPERFEQKRLNQSDQTMCHRADEQWQLIIKKVKPSVFERLKRQLIDGIRRWF